MLTLVGAPVPSVLREHALEVAHLRHLRSSLILAPHIRLRELGVHDERIVAHLDGLAVGGQAGVDACDAALESLGVGEIFAAAVRAIEDRDEARLDPLFALAAELPAAQRGLTSAFGWVSPAQLQGFVAKLLSAQTPQRRAVGLTACAMHAADPGHALTVALTDADPVLRARALQTAGVLGRIDLRGACVGGTQDENPQIRFWATWSAALLGERDRVIGSLEGFALEAGLNQRRALALLLMLLETSNAQAMLRSVARDPANMRLLIHGAGISGDPHYLPWLIRQMADDKLSRLAGESFSLITGVDLATAELQRSPPENKDGAADEDPEEADVAMDEDDNLPCPDVERVQAWWSRNSPRFVSGTRYFLGAPPTWAHCLEVLREGQQRQRRLAADRLCLVRPGTPLFNIAAPAWRQQRLLENMT